MKIYLATKSRLKINAIRKILKKLEKNGVVENNNKIISIDASSSVPATPYERETHIGAKNRASALLARYGVEGACYVGIESGLTNRHGVLFEECWCFILDHHGGESIGYSSGYPLPRYIRKMLKSGVTHIDVLRKLEEKFGIASKNTWGVYTNNIINRAVSIEEAFRNAFLSFIFH